MTKTAQNVTRAIVYHHRFEDPENPGEAYDVGRDLGMGFDFTVEQGTNPEDVFDEAYVRAGAIGVKTSEFDTTEECAGLAYQAWEQGSGRDPTATRSMAVGDIIVVGDDAWYVDKFGFEIVDVPTDPYDR